MATTSKPESPAAQLARKRWDKIPAKERAKLMRKVRKGSTETKAKR